MVSILKYEVKYEEISPAIFNDTSINKYHNYHRVNHIW